jgi:hypothetical protein
MKSSETLAKKRSFRYEGNLTEGLAIYLKKTKLKIPPHTIDQVKLAIRKNSPILMGACRDKPAQSSLGALLKAEGQSPQKLCYLIPILKEAGFCDYTQEGNAIVVIYKAG